MTHATAIVLVSPNTVGAAPTNNRILLNKLL